MSFGRAGPSQLGHTQRSLPLSGSSGLPSIPFRLLKTPDFSTSDSDQQADGKLASGPCRELERGPRSQTDMGSHPALSLMIRVGSVALASFPRLSKAMTNPGHVLASRDITLLMKVHIVKAMVFPVVTHI